MKNSQSNHIANPPKIILGGGVGPMAGVKLHEYIIAQTQNGGCDQGHADIIHASQARLISDRTKFLLSDYQNDPSIINPGQQMAQKLAPLYQAYSQDQLVVGVPCNTFHAPVIFDSFVENSLAIKPDLKIINMIQATVEHVLESMPDIRKIGLMSTTGTRQLGVYQTHIQAAGLELIQVSESTQAQLHDTIYNPDFGIKAFSSPVTNQARNNFLDYANDLVSQGAQVIILGCTEIPLALPELHIQNVILLDPMQVLAGKLLQAGGYQTR